MNKRILIVYTGGTIGMQASAKGYVPVDSITSLIAERLQLSRFSKLPEFDVVELKPAIDSANLTPTHWHLIAAEINARYTTYDGFVVLHGTDTMAYSASALSFIFQGTRKPIILTGSQIPLAELRSDGLDNLTSSLLIAADYPVAEVMIYFNGKLLRGNRASKVKATGLDAFDSPNFPWLGQVGLNIELHKHLELPATAERFINPDFTNNCVAILPIYPGLSAEMAYGICHTPGVRGLVIQSYGVGNLPDQNSALLDAIKTAAEQGCVIVNISQCLQAEVYQGHYACSSILNEIGVISGGDLTTEAAFSKLHFLLASEKDTQQVRGKMHISLAGEIDT